MKMYKWGIVSDLVRALSNTSNVGIDLNATGQEHALQDIADIMDTMMMNNCSFDRAVKIERDSDECFAEWLESAVRVIREN